MWSKNILHKVLHRIWNQVLSTNTTSESIQKHQLMHISYTYFLYRPNQLKFYFMYSMQMQINQLPYP